MRNVYLRADANAEIGSGHVSRMIALGEMLASHFHVILISKQDVEAPIATLVIENENEFLALLNEHAIAVLDGYHFDGAFQKAIREKGTKLVCIDDHQHQEYYADLVINHAPGVNKENIQALPHTKYLLGPQYALLKKPFQSHFERKLSDKLVNVMVNFGGSDVNDLSYEFVKSLLTCSGLESIKLVLGKDYRGNSRKLFDDRISFFNDLTPKKMRQIMRESDFAIVPSSTILLECLSQNLPCISGYYIENQKSIYKGCSKLGLIVPFGDLNELSIDALDASIDELRSIDLDVLQTIFDGKSGERIIEVFEEL